MSQTAMRSQIKFIMPCSKYIASYIHRPSLSHAHKHCSFSFLIFFHALDGKSLGTRYVYTYLVVATLVHHRQGWD